MKYSLDLLIHLDIDSLGITRGILLVKISSCQTRLIFVLNVKGCNFLKTIVRLSQVEHFLCRRINEPW